MLNLGGRAALLATLVLAGAPATAQPLARPLLDERRIARAAFGNDAPWYAGNIPFFDSADPLLTQVYYYRWQVFRAHQRDLGPLGYITTEFLSDVGWQRQPYASLNDATPFHINEGRWLRDRRYVDDHITYMYQHGGNDRHFSESIADATWGRYLADGDRDAALRHLPAMRRIYDAWRDRFDRAKGLYWIEPLLDATEYTIASIDASGGKDGFFGGHAFRPSMNAYMFANARAISQLSEMAGDAAAAADYAQRADALKRAFTDGLWSPELSHFVDRYKVTNQHVRYWDRIRGRELVGLVPWAFGMIDDPRFTVAWRHLLDPGKLGGRYGLRTLEPSYPHYMRQYRYDAATGLRECQWNGPVWPFQTTQVLMAMGRLLRGPAQDIVDHGDYLSLLRQYAAIHRAGDGFNLQENYDPDTGKPIVGLPRSDHYFHSAFDDLIVTGLAGLVPRADDVLEVDPLLPAADESDALPWFALQNVPYHGRLVTILWDRDGRRYRRGAGLRLYVDGREVASRPDIGRLSVPMERRASPAIARPINQALSLAREGDPRPSASAGGDPASLKGAIDGRVWFFPEEENGWSTPAGTDAEHWFAVDFSRPVALDRAELAFFADDRTHAVPAAYRVQYWAGGWRNVPTRHPAAVANGVTHVAWPRVTTERLRVLVRPRPGRRVRLVELKAF